VGKLKTPSIMSKCKMGDTILHFDAMEGREWSRIPSVASKHEMEGRHRVQKPPVLCFDAMGGRGWSKIPSVASKREMGGRDV